jgi:hypothetical protein
MTIIERKEEKANHRKTGAVMRRGGKVTSVA